MSFSYDRQPEIFYMHHHIDTVKHDVAFGEAIDGTGDMETASELSK